MSKFDENDIDPKDIVGQIGKLKIVNATGDEMPQELIDHLVESMLAAGVFVTDAEGNIVQNPDIEQGKLVGVEFSVDEEGVYDARQLDDDEIPAHVRRQ